MGDWGGGHGITDVGGKSKKSHRTCHKCHLRKPARGSNMCTICQPGGSVTTHVLRTSRQSGGR